MKEYVRKLGLSALGACSCLGFASSAFAALDTEFEIFVIDGSGTMTDKVKESPTPDLPPPSKWEEAFRLMDAKLESQANHTDKDAFENVLAARNHCIAVWVFADNAYRQVYPPNTSGQPWIPDPAAMNNGDFACAASDGDTAHYTAARTYLKDHVEYESTIAPQNGMPMTPLADATCAAIQASRTVQAKNSGSWRRIVLYSDGLENASSGECSTTEATPGEGILEYAFDRLAKDTSGQYYKWAGGTPANSWQYKMFSKAIVMNIDPYASGFIATASTGKTVNIGGVSYVDLDSRTVTPEESFSQFLSRAIKGAASAVVTKRAAVDVYAIYNFAQVQSNIPAHLQAFYDTLAARTGGTSIRVEYNANGPVGVVNPKSGGNDGYHSYKTCLNRLDGDTDCSGVVNEADFNQVLQSD